jgi:hypothetical protein
VVGKRAKAAPRRGQGTAPILELLVDNLDRAYRGRSWHGTSLRGTLRGLTPKLALWQPGEDRSSVWQYLLHAAEWKYVVARKLTGGTRGAFPRDGANLPALPEQPNQEALRADLALPDQPGPAARGRRTERVERRPLPPTAHRALATGTTWPLGPHERSSAAASSHATIRYQ